MEKSEFTEERNVDDAWSQIMPVLDHAMARLGEQYRRSQRCRQSVLRMGACLLGLFSIVSLIYAKLAENKPVKLQCSSYEKTDPTFADALAAVRWIIWEKIILPRSTGGSVAAYLPRRLRNLILNHLTAAA
jgi:hypothetical protein